MREYKQMIAVGTRYPRCEDWYCYSDRPEDLAPEDYAAALEAFEQEVSDFLADHPSNEVYFIYEIAGQVPFEFKEVTTRRVRVSD